ncbi:unnamed protein product [Echinostoma caproni]|uniref:SH2 domain-containing protein n=1 Tax=Echinostoma caproni TaxID=27848 RepID=A0A183AZ33_9TREM|nr:unnamed protein product [Echinostoma caproni]
MIAPCRMVHGVLSRNAEGYALSVLLSENSKTKEVKHYKIYQSLSGNSYFLKEKHPFPSIKALIEYYSAFALGHARNRCRRLGEKYRVLEVYALKQTNSLVLEGEYLPRLLVLII